ncbi:hypothetical protein C1645_825939 [Glomus cerebriforme]|uniref:Uncharacterized protein n=1 Tax=Glomus cerebriforme TaxID=658196 RepID=A0A397SRB0_9GLOM|nr:hypothetical protein C1645_825939 [Glomus cerebriforme]
MEGNLMQLSKLVILSAISNNEFGMFEYIIETDFSYLENIHNCYVFTKEVYEEITQNNNDNNKNNKNDTDNEDDNSDNDSIIGFESNVIDLDKE